MKVRGKETKVWGGVEVDQKQKEKWAEEILQMFENDPDEHIHYCLSGDTIVIGMGYDTFGIDIYFARIDEKIRFDREELDLSVENNIYCSCDGPTKMVPIGNDVVKVCERCKKEVKK